MKLSLVALSTAMLAGCSALPLVDSTEFSEGERHYQFQSTTSAMKFANESPLDLGDVPETTRVLALFGMPDLSVAPPGKFRNFAWSTSTPEITKSYITPALAQKSASTGLTSTDLAAVSVNALSGTGVGAGAAGAAGALVMIAGTDTSPDPRVFYSSAICYLPISVQPDIKKAYVLCIDQVVEDVKLALGPSAKLIENSQVYNISGSVDTAAGRQPVTLLVGKIYNHAAVGYAPVDKGSEKSSIFAIQMMRFGDMASSKATVEDIATAIRKAKRPSIAYRLITSEDYQGRKNADPIGVY